MKSLIEALADDLEDRKAKAVAVYRELLHRGGEKFSPADVARFKEAAGLLGKDMGQVAADYKLVSLAREWKAMAEQAPHIQREIEAAWSALLAHDAERAKLIERLDAERRELYAAHQAATSKGSSAASATERLRSAKREAAAILDGIDADLPPEPPLEEGGPFEVTLPRPVTGHFHGMQFVDGKATTTVVTWARQVAGLDGYVVRDLSKPAKAEAAPALAGA